MNAGVFKRFFDTVTAALSAPSPASPPTKPECMTQSEFDEAVGSAAHAASPPEPPASPTQPINANVDSAQETYRIACVGAAIFRKFYNDLPPYGCKFSQAVIEEVVRTAEAEAAVNPNRPSPPPAPVTPEWAENLANEFLQWGCGPDVSTAFKPEVLAMILKHAPAAAPDERVERLEQALKDAYRENQNMHCSTTISPKIGWDALERQTAILKAALAESRKV